MKKYDRVGVTAHHCHCEVTQGPCADTSEPWCEHWPDETKKCDCHIGLIKELEEKIKELITHDPKKAYPPTNMKAGTCDCGLSRTDFYQCYFPLYTELGHGHCRLEKGHD
jgi:hypothetical protein